MNHEDQRNRGQRALPGVVSAAGWIFSSPWWVSWGLWTKGPCLQLCPPGFRHWLSKQRNISNIQESMRVPAAVFSPYKKKIKEGIRNIFKIKSKGKDVEALEPQSQLGRVSQNDCLLQGPAHWHTGQAGDRGAFLGCQIIFRNCNSCHANSSVYN